MKEKAIGVYIARLMEPGKNLVSSNVIKSSFTYEEKEYALSKSENVMHNKEQHEQSGYYKEIAEILREYDHVLLFGPGTAKNELHNLLKEDQAFTHITVDVQQSDKIQPDQQEEYVKDYFSVIK
jgi:stalled ribosome rescue protein Dom34